MLSIDVHALTSALRGALPGAEPFAAIPMFIAQVRHLDPAYGVDLVERVVKHAHPSTWGFTCLIPPPHPAQAPPHPIPPDRVPRSSTVPHLGTHAA